MIPCNNALISLGYLSMANTITLRDKIDNYQHY